MHLWSLIKMNCLCIRKFEKICSTGKEVSAFEQAEIVASIPCQWKMQPSYYHSFGISQDYFIFVEQPFVFNLKRFLLNHFLGKPYVGAMDWRPDQKVYRI